MADISLVRVDEGEDPDVQPLWDSIWSTDPALAGFGDWVLADSADPLQYRNRGGLRATDALTTGILIQLMTHARMPDWMLDQRPGEDPGGWHGDSFDIDESLHEGPIGSLLWTLKREAIPEIEEYSITRAAKDYCLQALQTFVDQGLVYRFDVFAEVERPRGILKLHIRGYDPQGSQIVFINALPLA